MARLIRLQFRLALSIILAALLGGIWIGKQANRTPESAIAPTPIRPSPKLVELTKKYALAEFAALIGIPLALAGLMLTAIATRDTARQLQLVKAQSQPTFSLTLHQADSSDVFAGHNELAVVLAGNAESIVANVESALILRGHPGKPRWMLFPYSAWSPGPPKEGQVARFEADPPITSDLRKQKGQIILASTVTIHYLDLFGDPHKKFYQFSEVVSDFASVHYPREVAEAQGAACVQLINTTLADLQKAAEEKGEDQAYTIHSGASWRTVKQLAREVSGHQALGCLGPPFGKLR